MCLWSHLASNMKFIFLGSASQKFRADIKQREKLGNDRRETILCHVSMLCLQPLGTASRKFQACLKQGVYLGDGHDGGHSTAWRLMHYGYHIRVCQALFFCSPVRPLTSSLHQVTNLFF